MSTEFVLFLKQNFQVWVIEMSDISRLSLYPFEKTHAEPTNYPKITVLSHITPDIYSELVSLAQHIDFCFDLEVFSQSPVQEYDTITVVDACALLDIVTRIQTHRMVRRLDYNNIFNLEADIEAIDTILKQVKQRRFQILQDLPLYYKKAFFKTKEPVFFNELRHCLSYYTVNNVIEPRASHIILQDANLLLESYSSHANIEIIIHGLIYAVCKKKRRQIMVQAHNTFFIQKKQLYNASYRISQALCE